MIDMYRYIYGSVHGNHKIVYLIKNFHSKNYFVHVFISILYNFNVHIWILLNYTILNYIYTITLKAQRKYSYNYISIKSN